MPASDAPAASDAPPAVDPPDDDALRESVEAQLRWDTRLDASGLDAEVDGGVVTLTGRVPTAFARQAAAATVLAVLGVTHVENDLGVRPAPDAAAPLPDDRLRAGVRDVLRLSPDLDAGAIEVEAEEGLVTLTGSVNAYWKKARAEDVAVHVEGVVSVRNRLTVEQDTPTPDEAIREAVEAALERQALVDARRVDVLVQEGRVTLAGTVGSRVARQAAAEAAQYTLGVINVDNRLALTAEA
jgi:osmotically-inducible protein OsmY